MAKVDSSAVAAFVTDEHVRIAESIAQRCDANTTFFVYCNITDRSLKNASMGKLRKMIEVSASNETEARIIAVRRFTDQGFTNVSVHKVQSGR